MKNSHKGDRGRSLDRDSFERRQREKNERQEAMALRGKGPSGDCGESLCAWEGREEKLKGEEVKVHKELVLCPVDPALPSRDRTYP